MKIIYSKTTYRNAVYRALISILIGIVLIIWPHVALKTIVIVIGALFLLTGMMAFIMSYRQQQAAQRSDGLLSLNGIGSIILGILLVSIPLFHYCTDDHFRLYSDSGCHRPISNSCSRPSIRPYCCHSLFLPYHHFIGRLNRHFQTLGQRRICRHYLGSYSYILRTDRPH